MPPMNRICIAVLYNRRLIEATELSVRIFFAMRSMPTTPGRYGTCAKRFREMIQGCSLTETPPRFAKQINYGSPPRGERGRGDGRGLTETKWNTNERIKTGKGWSPTTSVGDGEGGINNKHRKQTSDRGANENMI